MADDYDAIVIGAGIGGHYCYLAVACGGKGYLGRLTGYLGVEVKINPCDTGLYYNGEFYVEPSPGYPWPGHRYRMIP